MTVILCNDRQSGLCLACVLQGNTLIWTQVRSDVLGKMTTLCIFYAINFCKRSLLKKFNRQMSSLKYNNQPVFIVLQKDQFINSSHLSFLLMCYKQIKMSVWQAAIAAATKPAVWTQKARTLANVIKITLETASDAGRGATDCHGPLCTSSINAPNRWGQYRNCSAGMAVRVSIIMKISEYESWNMSIWLSF